MADKSTVTRQRWLPLVAGSVMATSIVVLYLAEAAYPSYFAEAGHGPLHHAWEIGWPLDFVSWSADGELRRFRPLAFSVDVLLAVALVLGTAAAAAEWRYWPAVWPTLGRKALLVIVTTAICWAVLNLLLEAPLGVFLGWAALAVVYLGVPCTVYSVFTFAGRAHRFSLRALFIVVTCLCVILAAFAGSGYLGRSNSRDRDSGRVAVRPGTFDYGLMESIDTVSDGQVIARDYRLVKRTRIIPCTLGTVFGVEYELERTSPATASESAIDVAEVWHYPAVISNPRLGGRESNSESRHAVVPGTREVAVFRLSSPVYLMTGEWKFELWEHHPDPRRRRKLLEQVFVVGEDQAPPPPVTGTMPK